MSNQENIDFKNKFDFIAEKYDKVSNQYTVNRRIESLQTKKKGNVLEVGSATGTITKNLKNFVVCTDISFNMCLQAKMKRGNVICCDAEMLPFQTEKFDAIISSEMIYYLKKPKKFLKDAYKILKIDGEILISMANSKMSFIDRTRSGLRKIGLNKMYFDDGLKNFMGIGTLKILLKEEKFDIKMVEKKIILPYSIFDRFNRFFEKTKFNQFCIFVIVKATKR